MALRSMQRANLDAVKPDVHGLISKQSVMLDTVTATKVTFHPGAKWSHDLKEYAGTDSCLLPHVAYILQGAIEVVMDDGARDFLQRGHHNGAAWPRCLGGWRRTLRVHTVLARRQLLRCIDC